MLPCEVWDRLGALRQEEMLAVLAAFFCLLFFAAAKKSRCRPAQGRRLKQANKSRMPAKRRKHQTATHEAPSQTADASEKANTHRPSRAPLHAPPGTRPHISLYT